MNRLEQHDIPGRYLLVGPLLGYVGVTHLRLQIARALRDTGAPLLSLVPGLPQSSTQMAMHQPRRSVVREGAVLTYVPLIPVLLKNVFNC